MSAGVLDGFGLALRNKHVVMSTQDILFGGRTTSLCGGAVHLIVGTQDMSLVETQDMRLVECQHMCLVETQDMFYVERCAMCFVYNPYKDGDLWPPPQMVAGGIRPPATLCGFLRSIFEQS